jgi:hypothetical protein
MNIEHPTSNVEWKEKNKDQIVIPAEAGIQDSSCLGVFVVQFFSFDVGRSMFDVRRSFLNSTLRVLRVLRGKKRRDIHHEEHEEKS